MAPVLQLNKAAAATHSPWVKWQDSAVMAAHQLYPISNLNPFQGDLLIDAECGRDMTALKPKNLNHNQHLNKWLTPTWKTKGNTSYTYTHKNNNNYMVSWLRNRTQCTSNTQHFCRLHLNIAHIWTEKWHYNNKMSIISGIMKPFWWHFQKH